MSTRPIQCITLSDFNLDNFNALLENDASEPSLTIQSTGFGQLHQYLMDPNAPCWESSPDAALVWTRPDAVCPSFARLKNFEPVALDEILQEVDAFAQLVQLLSDRVPTVFIPSWTLPPGENGLGILNMQPGLGIQNTLMQMNLRLAELLAEVPGFFVLDANRWIHEGGRNACNPKLWVMAKIPFSNQVFKAAAQDVKSALRAVTGGARKLIVVDLDNTMWGGVVGDDGWENLQLGGHDAVGEAFVLFQKALKSLTNRGIVLGIVSKNTEEVALEAIEKHPEMALRKDDFAGWRINWEDKARNIADLTKELNLGLQSVVFLDDNPFERARVREALPEVLVPEWPESALLYQSTLLGMDCFDSATFTSEDRKRAAMYVAEKKRTTAKANLQSLDEWLHTLEMQVQVEEINEVNRSRIVQLLNKTNQMNLRTRRMTEAELMEWLDDENHHLLSFRVSDRFGDSGLTGILSWSKTGDTLVIEDFILSCRVMGRKVEETMVAIACEKAKKGGIKEIVAEYLPTAKNKPCLDFWKRSGFTVNEAGDSFTWSPTEAYPVPAHIELNYSMSV